jgi:benzil reductase ((S)-benzoin forming)
MSDRRLAIVTGTSSGIGEMVARQLLERGWEVLGIARRPGALNLPRYTHSAIDLGDVTHLARTLESNLASRVRDLGLTRFALVNNAADVALLGQVDQLDPTGMLQAYAVNTVAPVLLMGWLLRTAPSTRPLRIVNVSSGAAVEPFPGLGAYGATKAALRLAGMVLAAELDMRAAGGAARDATIWSYEPGVVETPMQTAVRSSTADTVPILPARARPANLGPGGTGLAGLRPRPSAAVAQAPSTSPLPARPPGGATLRRRRHSTQAARPSQCGVGARLPANQRMHQPGRGHRSPLGWHHAPVSGRFIETRRALQVMRGR